MYDRLYFFTYSMKREWSDLQRDESRHGEVLVGQHEQDHLGGHEQDHPRHQDPLPSEVGVHPPGQHLGLAAEDLAHLGLELALLLRHYGHAVVGQLGRRAQPRGHGFRLGRHH